MLECFFVFDDPAIFLYIFADQFCFIFQCTYKPKTQIYQ